MNVLRFGGVNVGGLLLISFPLGLLWGHCTRPSTSQRLASIPNRAWYLHQVKGFEAELEKFLDGRFDAAATNAGVGKSTSKMWPAFSARISSSSFRLLVAVDSEKRALKRVSGLEFIVCMYCNSSDGHLSPRPCICRRAVSFCSCVDSKALSRAALSVLYFWVLKGGGGVGGGGGGGSVQLPLVQAWMYLSREVGPHGEILLSH